MENKLRFKITDDSGFLAIADADAYTSFVDEDWEFSQLCDHFIKEMNKNSLVIWCTGVTNFWTVDIIEQPTRNLFYREFSKSINVTNNGLYLTNYEDLTMAAQFAEQKIPQKHNSDLHIKLDPGHYIITVKQMQNPEDYLDDDEEPGFEIVIMKGSRLELPADRIFWMD